MGGRFPIQPKLQERSPCNQVGQEKGKKKGLGWDLSFWEASVKEKRCTQADPCAR